MMSNNQNTQEITVASGFAALTHMTDFGAALAEDFAGLELTFDRIKIPAGGSTTFEISNGDEEEPQMVKDITGVILLQHPAFAYYAEKYTGGKNPPDCGSFDGVFGNGNPGGSCAACPYNQYGSGEGQGKACKNRRMLYILMEGELFPMMLSVPTGSLKEYTTYAKRQLSKGRKLSHIVTKISLKKAVNRSGITFSQAAFTFERMLNAEEITAIGTIAKQVKSYASNLSMAALAPVDEAPFVDMETGEVIEPLK
ncbi:MAG: hypothetical protein RR284_03565 [Ruthenibacterium sp.]